MAFRDYQLPRTRIRAWRILKNLTMEELAEKAGISRVTLWRLERGQTAKPQPDTARRLADALGITVFDLYRNPMADGS